MKLLKGFVPSETVELRIGERVVLFCQGNGLSLSSNVNDANCRRTTMFKEIRPHLGWEICKPLFGRDPHSYSFKQKGRYLRHCGYTLWVDEFENVPLFAQDATFKLMKLEGLPHRFHLVSINYVNFKIYGNAYAPRIYESAGTEYQEWIIFRRKGEIKKGKKNEKNRKFLSTYSEFPLQEGEIVSFHMGTNDDLTLSYEQKNTTICSIQDGKNMRKGFQKEFVVRNGFSRKHKGVTFECIGSKSEDSTRFLHHASNGVLKVVQKNNNNLDRFTFTIKWGDWYSDLMKRLATVDRPFIFCQTEPTVGSSIYLRHEDIGVVKKKDLMYFRIRRTGDIGDEKERRMDVVEMMDENSFTEIRLKNSEFSVLKIFLHLQ